MRRIAVMAALLGACAPQAGAPVGTTLPGPSDETATRAPEEPIDLKRLLEAVVHVRGLAPTRPIPFARVSDEAFDRAFREATVHARARLGVHGAPPGAAEDDPRYFLGFYDPESGEVLLRRERPAWLKEQSLRGTLAHEITHALQDQHFGLEALYAGLDPDARRAMRAVLEGDAEITRVGVEAYLDGRPVKRSIVSESSSDEAVPAEVQHPEFLADPDLRAQPADAREALMFPYTWGTLFVGAIYRAGGFPLVDRLYAVRPAATGFIYHPEEFVAGLALQPVRSVAPPPGFHADFRTSEGEFGLRQFLWKVGVDAADVERIGAAWRGDELQTAEDGQGRDFRSWTLAFSGEHEAAEMQKLLAVGGKTERSGAVVSFVAGAGSAGLPAVDPSTLLGPIASSKPPLGDVIIPPPPIAIEMRPECRGTVEGDHFAGPFVGLGFRAPAGYTLRTGDPKGMLFLMSNGQSSDVAQLTSVRPTPDTLQVMRQVLLVGTASLGNPARVVDSVVPTPFGTASYRYVEFDKDEMTAQMRLMTVCRGEALLVETRILRRSDAAAARALDTWFWSLDPKAVERSRYCAAVHEERTTDIP